MPSSSNAVIASIEPLSCNYFSLHMRIDDDKLFENIIRTGTIIFDINGVESMLPLLLFHHQTKTCSLLLTPNTQALKDLVALDAEQPVSCSVGKAILDITSIKQTPALIGHNNFMAAAIFWARQLKHLNPLVLLSSDTGFPFKAQPSTLLTPDLPAEMTACMPLLDDLGIASRLCSKDNLPGCFHGTYQEIDLSPSKYQSIICQYS